MLGEHHGGLADRLITRDNERSKSGPHYRPLSRRQFRLHSRNESFDVRGQGSEQVLGTHVRPTDVQDTSQLVRKANDQQRFVRVQERCALCRQTIRLAVLQNIDEAVAVFSSTLHQETSCSHGFAALQTPQHYSVPLCLTEIRTT